MDSYRSKPRPIHRAGTLNSLKEQLYSLNMRMLLAMQNHDEDTQRDIAEKMAAVQAKIDQMCPGGSHRRQLEH